MPRKTARQHRQFTIDDIVKGRTMTPKQRRRSNKGAGGIKVVGGFKTTPGNIKLPRGVVHKRKR